MRGSDIEERVDYLTSLKLLTSDKYGIWGIDIIGVIVGILFLAWGIVNSTITELWRLVFVILGAILLVGCSVRIERRYTKFKNKIFRDIESLSRQ